MKKLALALPLASMTTPALSQETTSIDRDEHLLDGVSFAFQNQTQMRRTSPLPTEK